MGARKTASKHRFGRAFRLSRHQQYAIHDVHQGKWRGYRTYHQLFTELLLLRATLQLAQSGPNLCIPTQVPESRRSFVQCNSLQSTPRRHSASLAGCLLLDAKQTQSSLPCLLQQSPKTLHDSALFKHKKSPSNWGFLHVSNLNDMPIYRILSPH